MIFCSQLLTMEYRHPKMKVLLVFCRSSKGDFFIFAAQNAWGDEMTDTTIITVIRNRNHVLEQVLPTWTKHDVTQILVFDMRDKSCERAYDVVAGLGDPRVVVYETEYEYMYSPSLALNALLRLVSTENVLRLDADIQLRDNFFELHRLDDDSRMFGRTPDEGTTGSFYCKTKLPFSVGGFNENIISYGWEDIDVFDKLQWWRGIHLQPFDMSGVYHTPHTDKGRIYSLVKDVDSMTDEGAKRILDAYIQLNHVIKNNSNWNETSRMTQWKHTRIDDNLYRTERDYAVF